MKWFQQNRFLGTFLAVLAVATLAALIFIWRAKAGFDDAKARFDQNAAELNRLQRLTPFPSEPNLKKMKTQAEVYGAELSKLKEELKAHVLPATPMAPNEFQARLRQTVVSLGEKARSNKVKMPEPFFLGFDEFATGLPDTAAAPLLGQQLAQAESLVSILIDARVDAVLSFRRVPAAELSPAAAPTTVARKPPVPANASAPLIERSVIDVSFVSSPGSARRILNQIATLSNQFFVVRTLHVLNEKDKGPAREGTGGASTPPASSGNATGAAPSTSALNFILGNERIQTSARVEMLRFIL